MDYKIYSIVPQVGDLLAYKNMHGDYIIGMCIDIRGYGNHDLYPYLVEWLNMSPDTKLDKTISYDYGEYCRKILTYREMCKELKI